MRKTILSVCATLLVAASAAVCHNDGCAVHLQGDITYQIPVILPPEINASSYGFQKHENMAQYKGADWGNVIGIARRISLESAFQIAKSQPEISFFFFMKGPRMVLEKEDGTYRLFQHGDTVFFSGEPCWGDASGFADGYVRIDN